MSRDEWRWAGACAALIVGLTCLPYLTARALTPPGMTYTWLLYNPDEPNVHLQWMREARDGRFFFADLFTTERAPDQFSNLFLWALGRLAGLRHAIGMGGGVILEYHLARIVSGWLLLVAVYAFAAQIADDKRVRRTTFWLAAVGSGLGWLDYWLGLPLEPGDVNVNLVMPEAVTFLSVLLYPLFSFSMFLMVATLALALANRERNQPTIYAAIAVCTAVLANVHTYDVIPLWLTLGLWALTTRRLRFIGYLAMSLLPSVAVVAWQFVVFRSNPVFREKALTHTPTPDPLSLAMTFGLIGVLAVGGAVRAHRDERLSLALLWAIIGLAVIHVPVTLVSFQRKMIEGLHLPLCFLAAVAIWGGRGASQATNDGTNRRGRSLTLSNVLIIATALSNLAFLHLCFGHLIDNNQSRAGVFMPPYYLRKEEVAAFDWLDQQPDDDRAVLCLPYLGAHIPGRSGRRVFIGHWAETLRFGDKLNQARQYFQTRMSNDEALQLFEDHHLGYVLYGSYERALFPDWHPPSWLVTAFVRGDTTVYEMRQPDS